MPIPAEQPRFDQPVVDARGFATQPWMNYWLRMASFLSQEDLSAVVAELQRRVTELEEGQTLGFQIIGDQSISVNGVPQPGHVVIITLQGDQQSPGNTQYYGTGPTGTKGWFPVSGAITVNAGELTKAVGTDGITTLGLADVVDSGAGTLIAITKDAKGRITGSRPATITGTAQQINVANGNAAAGLPTLSLAPEVLSALAEAVTALQPSDVTGPNSVKVTPNGSGGIILQLDNDLATPAALTEYSTNSAGQRGWWRPALFESTGVINGGALSINAGNNARFDMAQAVIGYTDWSVTPTQPTRVLLTVGPFSAQVVTGIATANASYVGIQMPAGTIVQQTSPFTNAQRRTIAQIGVLVHSNNTTINAINDQAATIRAGVNQVGDLMAAIGPLNLTGNIYSANGANLNINKSAGSIFKMGSNFQANNLDPHVVSQGAQTALTFRYRLSNGVEGADTTNINPNQYESAPGVLTAIPILGNQWHVQRINIFQSGLTRIQYGQQLYASAQAAINGILTDAFTTEQNIAENGILRCYLIINRGLLGLLGSATFAPVGKFGALQASSAATPNHNDLPGLQGGTTTERYHLTNAQLTDVGTIPNKYDKTGGTISGNVNVTGALNSGDFVASGQISSIGSTAGLFVYDRTTSVAYAYYSIGNNFAIFSGLLGANIQVVDPAGNTCPGANNTYQLGSASARWKEVFAVNGTINTSDARLKTEARQLSALEQKAGAAIARLPFIWEWLTGDRLHSGPTVQAVMAIFTGLGLDPFAYSFVCYDKWDAKDEVVGEDGTILFAAVEAGDLYSFRKDELLLFVVSAMAAQHDALEARVAALEAKA